MNSVFNRNKQPMWNESHKCSEGHEIDGIKPTIDPSIMHVQHPELIGRECLCRRLIYDEGECFCPAQKHWEIHWQPNPNY
jgi:hypothetical protein